METLNTSVIDAEEKSSIADNLKEQSLSTKEEKLVASNVSQPANTVDVSRDASHQLGSLDDGGDCNVVIQPNVCAPHAQPIFYRGYENTAGDWEDYSHYINVEGTEAGSAGVYNENPSLMFHTGYGYSPQMPYGPYSPVTTPLPSGSGDNQLYSPQQFPFMGPYYQQTPPPSMPYLTSPTSMSQVDLTVPVEYQDWLKSPDGAGSLTSLSSPVASPQPIGAYGSFGQSIGPQSSGVTSQHQRSLYGFGSSISSYDRGYFHGGMHHPGNSFGGSIPSLGTSGRSFVAIDNGRRRGKWNASSLCSCNGAPDFLSEQNRGPRASRPKNASAEQNLLVESKNGNSVAGLDPGLYNRSDFSTEYKDAKFFIIKSYSEDNVHKSIKYGVWASTANGNRKLDSAYHEAKEKGEFCPVFLFFSVNASAQFCGVAEMVGPVDFEKSVDYWQQDKWSGQFPVKWHIIKDVPNNVFRHIILENNDSKPVTNSRDTQEVKLEQGLEMLGICKNHDSDLSILDDFDFYEERQKAMQERKARQQLQQSNSGVVPSAIVDKLHDAAPKSGNVINQISKNFAHVVRLEESRSADLQTDRNNFSDVGAARPEDSKKTAAAAVGQSS